MKNFVSVIILTLALAGISAPCCAREKNATKEPIEFAINHDPFPLDPTNTERAKIYIPPVFEPRYMTVTVTSQFTGEARMAAAWHIEDVDGRRRFNGGIQESPITLVAGEPTKIKLQYLSFIADEARYRELVAKTPFEDETRIFPIDGQRYRGWVLVIMDKAGNVVAHTESSEKSLEAWMKQEKKKLRKLTTKTGR